MCAEVSLPPSLDETTSCQGIQILSHIVLDNKVFNRNGISKDRLNLYEQLCARGELEGLYQRATLRQDIVTIQLPIYWTLTILSFF